ncbi:MAG: hypothetical protein IKK50_09630 [Ruminiclostridium sp.]|nr:hypothetical protein [Ruminiclostridium sp.]
MIEEHKICGDCLMGIGIPDGGIAVIDVDRKPVVFDVVWCSDPSATIGGFLKQIIQTGPKPIVHTCYLDQSRNYMFHAPEIFGVVLKVLDYDRNVVWERPEPVEYAPIVHGRWEDNHCTACGMMPMGPEIWSGCSFEPPKFEYFMDFCPNCGADMRGGGEDA